MKPRHIVAIGGGSFLLQRENPLIEKFILRLTHKPHPKVCFVPTASGDNDSYVSRFYDAYRTLDCRPSHLQLFTRTISDLRSFVLAQDAIYVGGGNTANMLAVWRVHRMDKIVREAWEKGVVLFGVSAGSICWFECGVTDSFGHTLKPLYDGLGFLKGSNCPHYDSEKQRRPTYRRLIARGFPAGYAAEDNTALHFVGTELKQAISSRRNARVYRIELRGRRVIERVVTPRFLGRR